MESDSVNGGENCSDEEFYSSNIFDNEDGKEYAKIPLE